MAEEHIKILPVPTKQQYVGNGVTTEFQTVFAFFANDNIVVYKNDEIISEGFTITGAGNTDGGTITFDVAPAEGVTITLLRDIEIERITDFQEGGSFRAKNINDELDRSTAIEQQISEQVGRAMVIAPYVNKKMDRYLPNPTARKALVWNDEENGLINSTVNFDEVEAVTKEYRDEAEQFAINSDASAQRSEASAIRSETAAQSAETAVNGFDAHVEDSKIAIDQFTGMKIDDIDSHAAIKEQEFNTNAAEKQAQVDTSANNANVSELKAKASELNSKESERRASVWAEGTDSEVASLGGEKSAKGWAKRAEEIVGKGVINDDIISLATTYSSDKLEKLLAVNEDHDSVLDCLDVLDTNIGAKTTVPLSSLLAIDSDARPSHKAKGAEVYDEFGTMGIIDSVTPTEAVIITKESREKVRIVDTLDIQKNGLDQYFVDLNSNQIRNEIIKGKIVQLRFDDVITNTGEQLYPFETFDKDGYAVFRRNVISADKAERINIKVDYQGIVTFDTVTLQAANTDLNNITAEGKSVIANMAMPSNKYINLSPVLNQRTAIENNIAPANGFISFNAVISKVGASIFLSVYEDADLQKMIYKESATIGQSGNGQAFIVPIKKGYHYHLNTNSNAIFESFDFCRFIYTEGGQP